MNCPKCNALMQTLKLKDDYETHVCHMCGYEELVYIPSGENFFGQRIKDKEPECKNGND